MSVSFWNDSVSAASFPRLSQNLQTQVCVIGGGIAGLATAYLLQRSGKKVCLIEAQEIGSGQTGFTTAQWSPVLERRYYELEALHGKEGAKLVAESHTVAIETIQSIIQNEGIDCDLKRIDGYLFSGKKDGHGLLKRELEAVHRAGLLDTYDLASVPGVNFESPALCFPNQLQLHPLKLLNGLAHCFIRDGGQIYSRTPVTEVQSEKQKHTVITESGFKVECEAVVVATNSPIHDRFAIHTKQAPYRTYVVGFEIPKNSIPNALFWDTEDPYHYVRTQPHPENPDLDLLFIGGEDHKTGQEKHPEKAYQRLIEWSCEHFPDLKSPVYQWSGQVMESMDGLAFLGHHSADEDSVFVITGDTGNGMTHSVIGALLIRDQIFGFENRWEALYRPARKKLSALGSFLKENMNVMAQYSDWLEPGEVTRLEEIKPGEGAIFRHGAHLIAVYRDKIGEYRMYSAACPHLKGVVQWNSAEKSWDCPCHGSRFDAYGKVIEGPACSDLERLGVEQVRANSFASGAPS
jgi:glycine/D-amino acid oxidase-like deaminating enzyme/nitrite reductase/ring-hydroxylating ferredoxin subunit